MPCCATAGRVHARVTCTLFSTSPGESVHHPRMWQQRRAEVLVRSIPSHSQREAANIAVRRGLSLSLSLTLSRTSEEEEYAHRRWRERERERERPWLGTLLLLCKKRCWVHVSSAPLRCNCLLAPGRGLYGFNSRFYRIRGPPSRCLSDPCIMWPGD